MSDGPHEELDFDPLDATKIWPEDKFPMMPVGRMILDRNPTNYFAEVEQAAFGTGVLVDGLDLSDDKLLQGRTFSYSDTQRYRVGPNYLQLPINRSRARVATNQRDGQMAHYVDGIEAGENPHVNYEPSCRNGLQQQTTPGPMHEPRITGSIQRKAISRQNNFGQAGERYRAMQGWERDDLILNLVGELKQCNRDIQERMTGYFTQADPEYGRRVKEGLGLGAAASAAAQ